MDYVGRDGAADMRELAGRFATASTLPIVLDSTEPAVLRAGLECLGGRAVINSVNYEDGDGPESRFAKIMALVSEHGAGVIALTIDEQGQARTAEHKVAIAERLINDITDELGRARVGASSSTASPSPSAAASRSPGATGSRPSRRSASSSGRHPDVQTTLGLSNISFGLNPAARQVLNSVFLHECSEAGLDSAIVHASKILPINRIPEERREAALDLDLRPAHRGLRPAVPAARPVRGRLGRLVQGDPGAGARRAAAGRAAAARASSTASARASRPTSTRRWPTVRRWRSSTRCCSRA